MREIRGSITGISAGSGVRFAGLDLALGLAVAVSQIRLSLAVDRREDALFALPGADRFIAVESINDDDHVTPFALDASALLSPSVSADARFFQFLLEGGR